MSLVDNLISNLTFFRKKQTNTSNSVLNDENYFLKPHLKIVLNSPQIHEINPKHVVFKCSDDDVEYLTKLSNNLIDKFKQQIVLNEQNKIIHPLLNKNLFRCVLSNNWSPSNKKSYGTYTSNYVNYNLQFYINDNSCKFQLNKINKDTIVDKAVIYIKNIWNSNDKCGINCVIEELYINNKELN